MKNSLKNIFHYAAYPLFFVALAAYDFALRFTYGFVGGVGAFELLPCLFTVAYCAVLTSVAIVLPRIASRVYMILISLVFGFFGLCHAVFYNVFGRMMTISDILYAGEGTGFLDPSYFNIRKLMWISAALLLAVTAFAAFSLKKKKYNFKKTVVALVLCAIGVGAIVYLNSTLYYEPVENEEPLIYVTYDMATKPEQESTEEDLTEPLSEKEVFKQKYYEFKDPSAMLPMTGLYHYTCRNFYKVYMELYHSDEQKIFDQIENYHDNNEAKNDKNQMTGALKGKNVIMIMAESLDTWMVTEEYTPNIYKLQQEGINFEQTYTPLWLTAGTFSTEFISLTGIIMPDAVSSTDIYATNNFRLSLPALFNNEGYTSNSFHNSGRNIYNRGNIHENMGFEKYHSYAEMNMDSYIMDSQMINGYDQMTSSEPFFSYIITISGHGPYAVGNGYYPAAEPHMDKAKAAIKARGVTGSDAQLEELAIAVAQIMETDKFVGELMAQLEKDGLLENTAIVIYGDHYSKYYSSDEYIMGLKGITHKNLLHNTPFIIYSKDLKAQTVSKPMSNVDIFPTLVNIFGLDCDLAYFVGDDAFSNGGGIAYWHDGSYYDGTYHSFDGSKIANAAKNEISISRNILKTNFFELHGQ